MHVTIHSFGRPKNVSIYTDTLEPYTPVWYVPESQTKDYESEGAIVFPVPEQEYPMKSYQLNAALDEGFSRDQYVACIDDDFKFCRNNEGKDVKLSEFLDYLKGKLEASRFYMAGFMGITNTFWLSGKDREYGDAWGACTVHKPNPLRYDVKAKILEDMDMNIAQHVKYGGVIINHTYAINFRAAGDNPKKEQEGGYTGNNRRQELQEEILKYIEDKYNDPRIRMRYNQPVGEKVQDVQWKKLWRPENTLEEFF